jgi:hypothetical protein
MERHLRAPRNNLRIQQARHRRADVSRSRRTIFSLLWADHPPVHLLVASYLGVKPKGASPTDAANSPSPPAAALSELSAVFGLGQGDPHEGLAQPVLDFESLKRQYGESLV